ncbi:MAG: asparagine synthase (glutamine-hydrolyzing) [Desulfovibrio sp.]|nr:asparagine synthase (glutamine-hydrolyzing) [Desulfovibrio sp.]
MCGIAGFYGTGSTETLRAMTETLRHRGPDDLGLFEDGAVHLGHARLAIVDLACGGQPMRDADSGSVLIYNGELYNHLELRQSLEQEGQHFLTSHSDTETVLRSFLAWGPECFARFNGMFAMAIYCPKERRLWLARDRFGEKPLFYTQNAHGFAFASEIAALAQWPHFISDIDNANLQRFFSWGYLPAGRTLHPNCWSLPPASWLCLDLAHASYQIGTYWRFELTPDESLHASDEPRLVEELRHLLVQAVRRRLLSDVPLGVFLSGGLDSSCVLAAARQCLPSETISAFSIGFEEPSFDESANAREVAESLGVCHYVSMLTADTLLKSASAILGKMSEPLGDASLIPTQHLAAFAKKRVTVALSGDGGDELFAGYDPFAALLPASLYRSFVPTVLHQGLRKVLGLVPASDRNMSLEFKLKRVLRGLSYPENVQLPVWMGPLEPAELALFFDQPLSCEELYEDALTLWERHQRTDSVSQMLYFFTRFYLTDDILVKVDRACMMSSLESRAVFLDNDLVAFCQRLPNRFKYRNGVRKYLLRKALAGWLPERILQLPKKGFGIPLNRWLRALPAPRALPGMHAQAVDQYRHAHMARRGDYRLFLWALHVLDHLPWRQQAC